MQGRIVTFIKNIIRTIKNELKGPVISEKSFKINLGKVFGKEIGGKTKVEKKEIESYKFIKDNEAVVQLKDGENPVVVMVQKENKEEIVKKIENGINKETYRAESQ